MNIRWEHVRQQGWEKTGWDRDHGGEATDGRVELRCLWSFIFTLCSHSVFCTLLLPPLFTFSLHRPLFNPTIHPSHISIYFLHPLFQLSSTYFPVTPVIFRTFNPSISSVQISPTTRLSTGPVNWSGSTPCGYMTR